MGALLSQKAGCALTLDNGCDTSTVFLWKKVKKSKLPPGGGRAAAGGTSGPKSPASERDSAAMPKGTQWLAVTYLGGSQCKYRVQFGKEVRYVEGFIQLVDVMQLFGPRR